MSGWSYECPCGWSMRQAPAETDQSVRDRVDKHRLSHLQDIQDLRRRAGM